MDRWMDAFVVDILLMESRVGFVPPMKRKTKRRPTTTNYYYYRYVNFHSVFLLTILVLIIVRHAGDCSVFQSFLTLLFD